MLDKKIKFITPFKGFIPDPKPASFFIPKEYKNLKAYMTDSKKYPTVKKCIPFLDAYSLGYIIPFPLDIEYRSATIDPEDGKEDNETSHDQSGYDKYGFHEDRHIDEVEIDAILQRHGHKPEKGRMQFYKEKLKEIQND